jgi:2-methylcitrate dehydratase PrpD
MLENVNFAAFADVARAGLADLRERVSIRVAEPYASAYPRAWGSAVTVTVRGGQQLTVRRTHAKGDPEAAVSPVELIAKARMLMTYGGVRDPDRLIDDILALSDDSPLPDLPCKHD